MPQVNTVFTPHTQKAIPYPVLPAPTPGLLCLPWLVVGVHHLQPLVLSSPSIGGGHMVVRVYPPA